MPPGSASDWCSKQGRGRKGWLDLVLLDYALRACGGIDALAVTHLDSLSAFESYRWCEHYGSRSRLDLPRDIAEQERLTTAILTATPHYSTANDRVPTRQAVCGVLAERAGIPVAYGMTYSSGPSAARTPS